ncbi:MAG: hypothetical protein OXH97_00605 [Chloroflexota bacterium]|nr:hypothetical protein [Chloroflexota bacterium]
MPPAEATATPSPSPSGGATPVAAPGVAELGFALDRHSIWQDVYDTRTDAELACVHRELGDEAGDFLARPIFRDEPTQEWEVSMFACLAPQVARAVLLDGLVLAIAEDGLELSDAELACAREQVATVDVRAFIAADLDGAPGGEEVFASIAGCLGHLLIELMVVSFGLDPNELSTDEAACLRAFAERADWTALLGADDPAAAGDLLAGLFGCVPDLLVAVAVGQMGMELGDMDEDALDCLREWAAEVDIESFLDALTAGDLSAVGELASGLAACESVLGSAPAR